MIQTTEPTRTVRIRKALVRIRSRTAPDMIEPVVAAKSANAPQKMPLTGSSMFGPMLSPHGSAALARSSSLIQPLGIAL